MPSKKTAKRPTAAEVVEPAVHKPDPSSILSEASTQATKMTSFTSLGVTPSMVTEIGGIKCPSPGARNECKTVQTQALIESPGFPCLPIEIAELLTKCVSFCFFPAEDLSASVAAFDDILNGPFKNFQALSAKIGGDVATQGQMVTDAFTAQRQYLVIASKSKKPSDADLPMLLK